MSDQLTTNVDGDSAVLPKKPFVDEDAMIVEEDVKVVEEEEVGAWTPMNPYIGNREIILRASTTEIEDQLPIISKAPKFIKWVDSLSCKAMDVTTIIVTQVVWFGKPSPQTLGFLTVDVEAFDMKSRRLPSFVFIRGESVAVQVSVVCEGETYIIITKQVRLPSGSYRHEIPAGMVDDKKNINGVAIKEIREETGIVIDSTDKLKDLGSFWPSPGACDEEIHLYAFETEISREKMDELTAKTHGVGENEAIKIEFVPLKDYPDRLLKMGDAKAEIAFRRSMLL